MPTPSEVAAVEPPSRHTVGELLRETRLSYGGEIERIAATLRIRAAYLKAIEDGQYDRLPGPVYALGFVRAYANHLGLDAEEAVRRFKQETAGFEISRDLNFPVPLSERSIPGGTMLLAALILAVCGYGLWYYVSTGAHIRADRVSAVPPEFSVTPQRNPGPQLSARSTAVARPAHAAAAGDAVPPPSTSQPSVEPKKTAAPPAAVQPATAPPPAAHTADRSGAPGPAASAAPSPPAAATAPSEAKEPTPAPSRPTPASSPAATVAVSGAASSNAASAVAESATNAAAPAASAKTPSTTSTATPASQPHVYGVTDGPSRILIRADKDSWVLISDGNQVVMQGILHPGDSVRVPNQPGLVLDTGNASGLEFEVDGKQAPAIGGRVQHHIALDPTRLMDGTAVSD